MKINALRMYNVKRFAGRGVAIEGIADGVNVLCAVNEHGKSTSFEALHALFFQPHTGTPDAVRQLRPYSGGNPLVEADITTGAGRFRLTKQFYGGKRASVTDIATGQLLAQADEAEAFIANLIRGGTAGPAGLLWVRQGITGIERRSKSEEDGEKRVRQNLLSSVQGEVEAMTGGRRMAEIIEACGEELDRLVTATGRPKAGGLYEAAIEEHRRLAQEERRLSGEVTALRDALDKRIAALKRLAEIEDPQEAATRHMAVVSAEKAVETARAHGAALAAAEAEAALSHSRRDAAQAALASFRSAIGEARTLRERIAATQIRRDDAQARRDAAAGEIERAIAEVDDAEDAEREARDLLSRLDAALAARQAAEQRAETSERLAEAEALRTNIEAGEAAIAMLAIPADAVDQLQSLEISLATMRAAKDATLPTLRMNYAAGNVSPALLDGTPLADAVDHVFADTAHLEIAGFGTLTLRSNRAPEADKALREAERRHRALLSSLGVASLAEARQRQAAAREKSAELDLLRQGFRHVAPAGLQALREAAARFGEAGTEPHEIKGDPEAARGQVATAAKRVADARSIARATHPLRAAADKAHIDAETAHATQLRELQRVESLIGPEADCEGRERTLLEVHGQQAAISADVEAKLAALRGGAVDLASAEAALRRMRSVEDAAAQETGRLRETLADLNTQIRMRSNDAVEEAWREAADGLDVATERVKRLETEVALLVRLRDALQASRSKARELYLKPVITELRPLLGLLFDDIAIEFDENTLLPQKIRRNGQDEDVDRLSGGMREQLSVLTRLAFARLLARDGRPAPVILDDALVYSDDDRIERMFDALHRQSRDQQILVFSCRQRAFAKLGGTVLHLEPWQPEA